TYDYASHHQLRHALYGGGGDRAFVEEHEIGSRRELSGRRDAGARYRAGTGAWLENRGAALAPGGGLIVLVGGGTAADRSIRSDELIAAAASRLGAHAISSASQSRPDWMRGGRGAMREHLMLLQK